MPLIKRLSVRSVARLFREAAGEWLAHKGPRLGASLAFYTLLSMAPLAIISLKIVKTIIGDEKRAQLELQDQLNTFLGSEAASLIETAVANTHSLGPGWLGAVFTGIALIIAAMAVFLELQDSLNTIWEVPPDPGRMWWRVIRDRLLSFLMVLAIGLLMLLSFIMTMVVSSLGSIATHVLPATQSLLQFSDVMINFVVLVILFAAIYRLLPDVELTWRDTALGSVVTALMFIIGKMVIGSYLHYFGIGTAYGAASSVIILLLWLFYSMQVMLYGAELTRAFALRLGSGAVLRKKSIPRVSDHNIELPTF